MECKNKKIAELLNNIAHEREVLAVHGRLAEKHRKLEQEYVGQLESEVKELICEAEKEEKEDVEEVEEDTNFDRFLKYLLGIK